jgi:simple sugar transport system ATP-binding protein
LSVAAQQKLEILKAAFRQARILILDEPTAILAPEEAAELYVWLRKFAADGGTAIVVTHKLTEAREHTDDLTVLRSGRTVLQAASASLSVADLTHALIGEAIATPAPSRPASAGPAVVRLEGLLLRDERQVTVLRDASFEIRAGEILGIAGVEGSGHHHLLLALAGRHPSSGGRIQLAARTSIIPEDRHRNAVALPFTLAENVAIRNAGARRGALSWSRLRAQAAAFIEQFDVRAPGPNATMQTLSGGNQQKFVLAREFADQPQLIIAENPTRGLDIRASAFVREQLRNARGDGVAVALYSSDLDEILDLADRVIVIHSGRVVQVGMDRSEIGAAMLGAA